MLHRGEVYQLRIFVSAGEKSGMNVRLVEMGKSACGNLPEKYLRQRLLALSEEANFLFLRPFAGIPLPPPYANRQCSCGFSRIQVREVPVRSLFTMTCGQNLANKGLRSDHFVPKRWLRPYDRKIPGAEARLDVTWSVENAALMERSVGSAAPPRIISRLTREMGHPVCCRIVGFTGRCGRCGCWLAFLSKW